MKLVKNYKKSNKKSNKKTGIKTGIKTSKENLLKQILVSLLAFLLVTISATCGDDINSKLTSVSANQLDVKEDKAELKIVYQDGDSSTSVMRNISLVVSGSSGTSISWKSNLPEFVSSEGMVNRPSFASGNKEVILSATILKDEYSEEKEFTLTVIKVDEEQNCSNASNIEVKSLNFIDYVSNLKYAVKDGNQYSIPNSTYLEHFKNSVTYMVEGNFCSANASANNADMKIIKIIDSSCGEDCIINKLNSNAYYCMVANNDNNDDTTVYSPSTYRGVYCVRDYQSEEASTITRNIHVSAPHPIFDGDTNIEAAEVFQKTLARYFSVSTTHRCNSATMSSCKDDPEGSTSACGDAKGFRISDMAHNNDSLFHHFTIKVNNLDLTTVTLQLHGFGDVSSLGDEIAISSVGSYVNLSADRLIRKFTDALNNFVSNDSDSLIAALNVYSCNDSSNDTGSLCATYNPQGRYINGSTLNSCTTEASSFSDSRFIHLEQRRELRGGGTANLVKRYDIIINAIKEQFQLLAIYKE